MSALLIAAVAAVVLAGALAAFLLLRRSSVPSEAMLRAIASAIPQLQRQAARHILPAQSETPSRMPEPGSINLPTRVLMETIRFIYSIEHHERGFLHIVSSQMVKPKGRKYQLQCVALALLTLQKQVEGEDVAFDIQQSELGTMYVYMLLSTGQQARFCGTPPVPQSQAAIPVSV